MKLIIGLGNPGSEFAKTRHNIGFEVVDAISDTHHFPLDKLKFNAQFGKGKINGEDLVLVKPLTYMNLSGEAVAPLMKFYQIPVEDILVVYDDMDLPLGKIRLREKGSAGGHNGIKSLIQHLGTQEFKRIRIGIGRPNGREPVVDFVLKRFSKEDQPVVERSVEEAQKACEAWLTQPFLQVMNAFNG
ncbi:aminoacyl-tRNA hydrolase [Pullulanibacillus sp. KACC 23026]|uniref:aminoacyl-tRNA hydrolase n=1 Tax=Pullulanibacillus sp. KACC 23026 TaxID=3028315 RepID=UPI0023B1D23D|nr:aminoacyl-tRNA hydrolase [Pullulanibacillus sp. KACC 23026]WEG12729.1 aminoacyl-tRNA hydrolase [Pullulanibacillus sp. KACC 23026]